jgi:N-dimethylarginine dimethylaminohydrolase
MYNICIVESLRKKLIGSCCGVAFAFAASLGVTGDHPEPSLSEFLKYMGTYLPIKREDKSLRFDMKAFDHYFAQAEKKLSTQTVSDSFKQKIRAEVEKAHLAEMPEPPATTLSQKHAFVTLMIDPHENTLAVTEELQKRVSSRKNWELIKDAIKKSGGHVETMDGADPDGGMREIFTRDRFVIIDGNAFIPDTRKLFEIAKNVPNAKRLNDYNGEINQIKKFLNDRRINTTEVSGSWFEGGNVIVHPHKKIIFMGLEPFADPESAKLLESSVRHKTGIDYDVIPIKMAGYEAGKFYHLDTFMSPPLKNGEIFLHADILDAESLERLRNTVGKNNIHLITREEALMMGTNLNNIHDNNVVVTKDIPRLSDLMKKWGYNIISPQDFGIESFQISNAGVRCMTSFPIFAP